MKLDRVLADREGMRDLAVPKTVRDEREHIMLARRQRFNQRLFSPRRRKTNHGIRHVGAIDQFEIRIRRQPSSQRVTLGGRAPAHKYSKRHCFPTSGQRPGKTTLP